MNRFSSSQLRILEFNVENLFLLFDDLPVKDPTTVTEAEWQRFSTSTTKNKPLKHVLQVAQTILHARPDVVMLCEVGGRESLVNFNKYFLNSEFVEHIIEGNSDRGIDIGYLTRKTLPFKYDLISHKNRSIDFLYPHEKLSKDSGYADMKSIETGSHRFSRDVLELRLFDGASEPAAVFLLVHLKSQLDREGLDPKGKDRRRAEFKKLIQIQNEIRKDFSHQVPIILGGDFNGVVGGEQAGDEFAALADAEHLQDALALAGVPEEDRFTYLQMWNNRPPHPRQIDYIFVDQMIANRVNPRETKVCRFMDEFGMNMLIPRNLNERRLLPSDHYPVLLTLEPE